MNERLHESFGGITGGDEGGWFVKKILSSLLWKRKWLIINGFADDGKRSGAFRCEKRCFLMREAALLWPRRAASRSGRGRSVKIFHDIYGLSGNHLAAQFPLLVVIFFSKSDTKLRNNLYICTEIPNSSCYDNSRTQSIHHGRTRPHERWDAWKRLTLRQ